VLELVNYLRSFILLKIGEFENLDPATPTVNESRTAILKSSEEGFREILKRLSTFEEISYYTN
jgi:hypothetical protein